MSAVDISREAVEDISTAFITMNKLSDGQYVGVVDPDKAMKALDMLRALRDRVDDLEAGAAACRREMEDMRQYAEQMDAGDDRSRGPYDE